MIRYTGWVGLGGPMYRLGKEAYSLLIVDNLRIRQDHFYWRHSSVSPRSYMKGLKKKSVVSQVWLFCFSGGNKTEEKEGWWSGHWLPKVPVLQIFLKYIYTFESVKQLCYIRIGWSQKKQHWDYHLTLSDPSFGSCDQKQSWVVFSLPPRCELSQIVPKRSNDFAEKCSPLKWLFNVALNHNVTWLNVTLERSGIITTRIQLKPSSSHLARSPECLSVTIGMVMEWLYHRMGFKILIGSA